MNSNKIKKYLLLFIILIASNICVINMVNFDNTKNIKLEYSLESFKSDNFEVYWKNENEDWSQQNSVNKTYDASKGKEVLKFNIPTNSKQLRMDFGNQVGIAKISDIKLEHLGKKIDITDSVKNFSESSYIKKMDENGETLEFHCDGSDPFIVIDLSNIDKNSLFVNDMYINYALKIIACIICTAVIYLAYKKRRVIYNLIAEVYRNKTLLWGLAKNDFKTRYAGSYLGVFWAFVQPIITVLIYWFVFQVGFRSAPMNNFPYVLWLIVGIVPWFFFSEALMNATNSLLEYSYLVKKVVFKISILPVVKIISALFVHAFFVAFTILVYALNGYFPTVYSLQIVYYSICALIFALSISYATSAMVLFFKDLGQIINIFMQIGIWMTPIMWSDTMIPQSFRWILKINPMYYVVEGYRDTFINNVWFWDKPNQTIYFWLATILLFFVGIIIFKKLKPHFSDVL